MESVDETIQKKIASLVIPRLNGESVKTDFDRYLHLAKSGFGGFIIFGGEKNTLKEALQELERAVGRRLLILSDLEQGLGQQVSGGSLFPPAMAIAHAVDPKKPEDIKLFRKSIAIISQEALSVGINVILAPVADIHTNPENPIICTRAYGTDPARVSWFVKEYISSLQGESETTGLLACVKHFPGHGDTNLDSHLSLPIVSSDLNRLHSVELPPFSSAIAAGVEIVMVGHLLVDAIDSDFPATLSSKTIQGLLRRKLGFDGVVITDAMNMGAVKNTYGEAPACLMALMAGCDILLHPDDPEGVVDLIAEHWEKTENRVNKAGKRVKHLQEKLGRRTGIVSKSPLIKSSQKIVNTLSRKSLRVKKGVPCIYGDEVLFVIDEDSNENSNKDENFYSGQGSVFIETIRQRYPRVSWECSLNALLSKRAVAGTYDRPIIVALFSRIAAWKGRSGLSEASRDLLKKALSSSSRTTVVSFGSPSLLEGVEANTLINAWWPGKTAQKEAAKLLIRSEF